MIRTFLIKVSWILEPVVFSLSPANKSQATAKKKREKEGKPEKGIANKPYENDEKKKRAKVKELLFRLASSQTLLDTSEVNAKKLVCGGSHINKKGFALAALFIKELINRLITGRAL